MSASAAEKETRFGFAPTLALLAALTAGYYLLNPFWWGDGIYYARHVRLGPAAIPLDSGHLMWRPLAFVLWRSLKFLLPGLDPFVVLKFMSALGTALGVLATYQLGILLTGRQRDALLGATLMGVSMAALAYGGSGCSYTTAMSLGALAFVPIVPRLEGEWKWRAGLAAAVTSALGAAAWGPVVLTIPGVGLAAALASRGGIARRVIRGGMVSGAALGLVILMTAFPYFALKPSPTPPGYVQWMGSGRQNVEVKYTLMNAQRAVLGFHFTMVNLAGIGRQVKQMLLGLSSGPRFGLGLLAAPVAMLVSASFLFSLLRLIGGRVPPGPVPPGTVAVIGLGVIVPVSVFAAGWMGTDVERFALAIPMLALLIGAGLGSLGPNRAWIGPTVVGLVALVNFATLVIPAVVTRDRNHMMAVGRIARLHVPPKSTLFVAGHELTGDVTAAARYYYDLTVFNISEDVQHYGAAEYRQRIRRLADSTIVRGGKVAVISDLIGEPTPGGIGFVPRERAGLEMDDLVATFRPWARDSSFQVDGFRFVEVSPPR